MESIADRYRNDRGRLVRCRGGAGISAGSCRAALSAAEKKSSRGRPTGHTALLVVIEIIALPADSTAITLMPRARS
jgi:hypothetical protein